MEPSDQAQGVYLASRKGVKLREPQHHRRVVCKGRAAADEHLHHKIRMRMVAEVTNHLVALEGPGCRNHFAASFLRPADPMIATRTISLKACVFSGDEFLFRVVQRICMNKAYSYAGFVAIVGEMCFGAVPGLADLVAGFLTTFRGLLRHESSLTSSTDSQTGLNYGLQFITPTRCGVCALKWGVRGGPWLSWHRAGEKAHLIELPTDERLVPRGVFADGLTFLSLSGTILRTHALERWPEVDARTSIESYERLLSVTEDEVWTAEWNERQVLAPQTRALRFVTVRNRDLEIVRCYRMISLALVELSRFVASSGHAFFLSSGVVYHAFEGGEFACFPLEFPNEGSFSAFSLVACDGVVLFVLGWPRNEDSAMQDRGAPLSLGVYDMGGRLLRLFTGEDRQDALTETVVVALRQPAVATHDGLWSPRGACATFRLFS